MSREKAVEVAAAVLARWEGGPTMEVDDVHIWLVEHIVKTVADGEVEGVIPKLSNDLIIGQECHCGLCRPQGLGT